MGDLQGVQAEWRVVRFQDGVVLTFQTPNSSSFGATRSRWETPVATCNCPTV